MRFWVIGWILLCTAACTSGRQDNVLTVFAASSLVNAFTTLTDQFEADHPNTKVRLVFAGSQMLRTQIEHGAKADIFVSAHYKEMKQLIAKGVVHSAQVFARNRLVIICRVSPDCTELSWSKLDTVKRLGVGLEASPIGWHTARALAHGGERFGAEWIERVRAQIVTLEPEVRRLRARVELGSLDAAIVYQSDVPKQGDYRLIRPPNDMDQKTRLWVAQVKRTEQPELTSRWQRFNV